MDYEQLVHAGIDAGDETTLERYAEYVSDKYDGDHLYALALAILTGDDAGRALALLKIEREIDRQRAPFMAAEATRLSKLADDHEYAKAELDAALKGAA